MGLKSQQKGAQGERELVHLLRDAGYHANWGGNKTYGAVPDVSGLPGVHVECKRREAMNLYGAMEQAQRDAIRFQDGSPTVFHRRNGKPWLVTMLLPDWLKLYEHDHNAHARFCINNPMYSLKHNNCKGELLTMNFWETEKPVRVDTGKNIIEFFTESGNLCVSKPDWTDKRTGERKRGKTVFLSLDAVKSCPDALKLLRRVVKDLEVER